MLYSPNRVAPEGKCRFKLRSSVATEAGVRIAFVTLSFASSSVSKMARLCELKSNLLTNGSVCRCSLKLGRTKLLLQPSAVTPFNVIIIWGFIFFSIAICFWRNGELSVDKSQRNTFSAYFSARRLNAGSGSLVILKITSAPVRRVVI